MSERLLIVVVERDPERARQIIDGLRETGDHEIHVLGDEVALQRRIAALNPDIVLIDVANPSRDALEELTLASAPMERPVAMFVEKSDAGMTRTAIEAGVSAYVVDGLRPERLKPVIDAAVARFHMIAKMRAELAATKAALEERKIVDRAKGILMRAKGLGEDEAYSLLRKTAMDQGRKIGDVAQALVTATEMLR